MKCHRCRRNGLGPVTLNNEQPFKFAMSTYNRAAHHCIQRWTCVFTAFRDSHSESNLQQFRLRKLSPRWTRFHGISKFYVFIRPFEKRTYYAMAMSVRPSVRPSFPDFFSTCFEISIWNLVYAFSRWHDMSSLSFITIGSLWPSLQPKVGQTQFLQSWPYKSR